MVHSSKFLGNLKGWIKIGYFTINAIVFEYKNMDVNKRWRG